MTDVPPTTAKTSGGLLLHRQVAGELQVLIGHMGGPFWARKHDAAWSIPKGELEPDEEPAAAAEREFAEELGVAAPVGPRTDLGSVRQSNGKTVLVWAMAADLDVGTVRPGTFEMEWPRGSGRRQEFPELDRVEWVPVAAARDRLVKAQREFLDRLEASLEG